MSPAAATSCGPTGDITAPTGTYVTSWGLRSFIENASGYGWTWESGTGSAGQPSLVAAELRSSDGLFRAAGAIYSGSNLVLHAGNYNSYSPTLTGTGASGSWSINASTATTFSTDRTNYKGVTDGAVAGQLMWKNYGNSHTIFDSSAGTAPGGASVNRWTPDYPVENNAASNTWGYNPVLMGWNGSNTYGVKVDWSRYAVTANSVVTIQDSAPTGVDGKLWWESDTGRLKVYYSTASAWVDTQPMPDMNLYYPKAGGTINGDVSIQLTLNVVGNTLVQGNISSLGDIIAYSSSDIRLKDNISVIKSPLEKISKISGVSFNWNDKQSAYEAGKKDYGVIAQEVEEVLPELVTTRENGYKAVRYEKIVSLLIEATKAQQTQIEDLRNQVNELTQKLNNS